MNDRVELLAARAGQLANAGQWDEAERTWLEVRRLAPRHAKALFSLGVHALKRGDTAAAHELLREARKESPGDLLVLMMLVAACRQREDLAAEREARIEKLENDLAVLKKKLATLEQKVTELETPAPAPATED